VYHKQSRNCRNRKLHYCRHLKRKRW